MDISPQDLGTARQARLTQAEGPQRSLVPWFVGFPLVAVGIPMLSFPLLGNAGHIVLCLVLVCVLFLKLPMTLWSRQRPRRTKNRPLTQAQLQRLQMECHDPLERQYLGLVRTALQLPKPLEEPAQSEVRDAVQALGSALDHLPPVTQTASDGSYDLTVSAAGLAVDAEREGDPVIAASLRRRADNRRQQAETVALLETQARRAAALRDELSDEIASLQASLTVLCAPGVWSAQEMADVAAGISWIALKAKTLASAQAELDEALRVPGVLAPLHEGRDGTRQRLTRPSCEDTTA